MSYYYKKVLPYDWKPSIYDIYEITEPSWEGYGRSYNSYKREIAIRRKSPDEVLNLKIYEDKNPVFLRQEVGYQDPLSYNGKIIPVYNENGVLITLENFKY